MKKKTWIIILAVILPIILIVIGGVIFIGGLVMFDLKVENRLKSEFVEAREMITSFQYNDREVYEILDRTISKREYKKLETSYKAYLKDIYTTLVNARNIMDDDKITAILSADNYLNDGPDFKLTKKYIKDSKNTLQDCKEKYEELFSEKKVNEYIINKDLSDYYIDIYNEEVSMLDYNVDINDSIGEFILLLDNIDSVIDFLIANKDSWKIENKLIYFKSDELKSIYNSLLDNIILENYEEEKTYSKSFGEYKVPSNWIESKTHSTNNKFFYVLSGHDNDVKPNNISINMGTNKYSVNEHDKFKTAIMQQLSIQIGKRDDLTINATGSKTANDYILYTFIINDKSSNITTTQYYIVGDYKYILVHETVFDEYLSETSEVAKKIVNTFIWK